MRQYNRREMISSIAGISAGISAGIGANPIVRANNRPVESTLGIVMYCVRIRREALLAQRESSDLFKPLTLLKYCQSIGAGGMQCSLKNLSRDSKNEIREYAEENNLFIEAIITLPKNAVDVERFDNEMQAAKKVGALAARTTIIPGRRYEFFNSLAIFKEYVARGRQMLERGAKVAEKHKFPIAVENHKDQRNSERLALLKSIDSEYVGACLDTGNSFALLEDPIQTVRDFAPWAHSVHLKDQSLELVDDGFLLGDVPLGQGSLDLKTMVSIIRKTRPNVRFSLELITRDPLSVPCLSEEYWRTFPRLPAQDLARTLRYVRTHTKTTGQHISRMSADERLATEDANVRASLEYARTELGI